MTLLKEASFEEMETVVLGEAEAAPVAVAARKTATQQMEAGFQGRFHGEFLTKKLTDMNDIDFFLTKGKC